ncbi:MAG TPA: preprotein translocase subunit SecE [Dehalococcoidales bacterium]
MPQNKQAVPAPKPKNAISRFFSDTIAEMKKVTWLSRRETIYLTGLVLLVAVAAGIVLGLFDWSFSQLINKLVLGG